MRRKIMKNTMLKAALAAMLAVILCAAAAVAEPQIVDDPLGAASPLSMGFSRQKYRSSECMGY